MSRSTRAPSLLSINELRLDALRGFLSAHAAGKRIHQRAQISELADGTWMAGAGCNRHFVHSITRLQRRSCRHRAVSTTICHLANALRGLRRENEQHLTKKGLPRVRAL